VIGDRCGAHCQLAFNAQLIVALSLTAERLDAEHKRLGRTSQFGLLQVGAQVFFERMMTDDPVAAATISSG
jgi:hypothetical protein